MNVSSSWWCTWRGAREPGGSVTRTMLSAPPVASWGIRISARHANHQRASPLPALVAMGWSVCVSMPRRYGGP